MKKPKSARATAVPAAARPDWRKIWEALKSDACHLAWLEYMRDPTCRRMFMYYHRADGPIWGSFHLVKEGDDPPPNTEPVTAEHIPPTDERGIRQWLEKDSGRLPMLGTPDPD